MMFALASTLRDPGNVSKRVTIIYFVFKQGPCSGMSKKTGASGFRTFYGLVS